MQVVKEGMKSPCTKRAAISRSIRRVMAQATLASATTQPPPSTMGRIGNRSARTPKGRLASAIPSTTAETVSDATAAVTANSPLRIGSTGCVT
jgi:hypothetical protein